MKLLGMLVAGLSLAHSALAGVNAFDYRLGATNVSEDQYQIVIHAQPAVTVAILPGGRSWPALSLDEAGRIYAGGTVIDSATGRVVSRAEAALALPHGVEVAVLDERYRFRRDGKECRLSPSQLHLDAKRSALDALKDANLELASASDTLLALVTRFGPDGTVAGYLVERWRNLKANDPLLAKLPAAWLEGQKRRTL